MLNFYNEVMFMCFAHYAAADAAVAAVAAVRSGKALNTLELCLHTTDILFQATVYNTDAAICLSDN